MIISVWKVIKHVSKGPLVYLSNRSLSSLRQTVWFPDFLLLRGVVFLAAFILQNNLQKLCTPSKFFQKLIFSGFKTLVPKYIIKKLQSVQNAAARLITRSRKCDHITPILLDPHWLPVSERIKFKILLLTFKPLHLQAQSIIKTLSPTTHPLDRFDHPLRSIWILLVWTLRAMALEHSPFQPLNSGTNYPTTYAHART